MKHTRKLVIFIATSLDGYIATEDDSLEWLFKVEGEGDNGYSEFYETIDTMLLGRRTYDWLVEQVKGDFPHKDKQCFVFSKSVKRQDAYVNFIEEDVATFVERLKQEEGSNIWCVGGGELIHALLTANLVDEFIVTVAPVILGKGIRLFKEGDYGYELVLKGTKRFNQFVELHYEVKK